MGGAELRVVGKALRKVDATAKVTGTTKFADDLFLPRMLYAKLLRSPHPHARIVAIDPSAAAALPGVKAVLTGKDLPIPFGILPVSQDEHALALDKVRFVGDPVAAVAATTEETAAAALARIAVEYEPLRPVTDAGDALDHPEPRIHDYGDLGNVHKLIHLEFGDVEQGFQDADLVREDTFFFEGSTHLPMEQHAAVADWSADGKLTLWSSTQTPHYVHRALAKVLELSPARIRVVACPNGGGFGGKSDPFSHEIVAAKLAMVTGRPVKITLTREEVFYCHRGRHPTLMWVKTGVKKDGAITGMHFRSLLDGGGYGSYGVASTYYTGALQTVTYHVPRYKFQGARAFTNKPPCGPKRGHGTPQPRFALEVHLDKIAEQLGLDPAELRLKHLVPPNSITANWLRVGTMGLGRCIEKVIQGSGWKDKFRKLPTGKGIGLACSSYITGAGLPIYWNPMPHSGVQLKCDRGGGVTAFCGSTEIGQGSDSVLAAIVAEVLGLDPLDVAVVTGDTDLTPVARLFLQRLRGGGRRRPGHGDRARPQDLDRARRGAGDQRRDGDGPDRRLRVHGPGRGADGGDGLPGKPQRRAQDSQPARIQEPDHARDVRRGDLRGRGPRSERPVRGQGVRPGSIAPRTARRGQRRVRRRRRAHRRGAHNAGKGV